MRKNFFLSAVQVLSVRSGLKGGVKIQSLIIWEERVSHLQYNYVK